MQEKVALIGSTPSNCRKIFIKMETIKTRDHGGTWRSRSRWLDWGYPQDWKNKVILNYLFRKEIITIKKVWFFDLTSMIRALNSN